MNKNYMLSENIKSYLKEKGIKQKFLSDKIGLNNVTLSTMLNGTRKITAEEYLEICKALNVNLELFASHLEQAV